MLQTYFFDLGARGVAAVPLEVLSTAAGEGVQFVLALKAISLIESSLARSAGRLMATILAFMLGVRRPWDI